MMDLRQRRIAISSAEKMELIEFNILADRMPSTLKAQLVEVADLEPSVKHNT
jgi:hypothetical protein